MSSTALTAIAVAGAAERTSMANQLIEVGDHVWQLALARLRANHGGVQELQPIRQLNVAGIGSTPAGNDGRHWRSRIRRGQIDRLDQLVEHNLVGGSQQRNVVATPIGHILRVRAFFADVVLYAAAAAATAAELYRAHDRHQLIGGMSCQAMGGRQDPATRYDRAAAKVALEWQLPQGHLVRKLADASTRSVYDAVAALA